MKVLVVVAHPDDEVIGVGGTLAKHARQGDHVEVLILGDGKTSRQATYSAPSQEVIEDSRCETVESAHVLGLRHVHREELPDNRFDTLPLLDVVKLIERYLVTMQPSIVYTHFSGDLNIDHQVTARAVITATRLLPNCGIEVVLAFETLSATEWNFEPRMAFTPNYFVDIGAVLSVKMSAMAKYMSELRVFPHPRSLEAIRLNALLWGAKSGLEAAEAFFHVRTVIR
jgi:LmbE family N-acetylglucosaminyl deacetylase